MACPTLAGSLPINNQLYLDCVLNPGFCMVHGPELDEIAFLSIAILPLAYDQLVTFRFLADIPHTTTELHQRIAEYTALDYLSVHYLALEFRFATCIGGIGKRVRCELTVPNRHNLTDAPHHQVILQYLFRWGLYRRDTYAKPTGFAKEK